MKALSIKVEEKDGYLTYPQTDPREEVLRDYPGQFTWLPAVTGLDVFQVREGAVELLIDLGGIRATAIVRYEVAQVVVPILRRAIETHQSGER